MSLLPLYIIIVLVLHIIPYGDPFGGSFDLSLNRIEIGAFRMDYLLHAAVFIFWQFLLLFRVVPKKAGDPGRLPLRRRLAFQAVTLGQFGLWIIAGIIFAAAAEGIQYWLPYRAFNLMDVIFNILGVLLGAALTIPFILSKIERKTDF